MTAKRDRVSIGRGEQNCVGPSRVECDRSSVRQALLHSFSFRVMTLVPSIFTSRESKLEKMFFF